MEEEVRELGISAPEGHMLAFVATYGPCRVGELVRVLGFKKTTTTGMLDRLEAQGLVRRTLNQNDRRSLLIQTTARGGRHARRAMDLVVKMEEAVLNLVAARDVEGFDRVLQAFDDVTGVEVRRARSEVS